MKRLSIVVMLLGIGACKKKVDTGDFEGRLKKRTDELGLTGATVSCPKGVEAKVGQSFECSVSIGGRSYVLVATVTKVDGKELGMDTAWKDGEAIINAKLAPALGTDLGKQFELPVTVDCGKDAMLFLDKARNVTCDLTVADAKAKVIVTFDDKLVPTAWKLDPQLLAKTKLEGILLEPVRAKTSPTVTVTCGDKPLVPRPADGTVWCEIADGAKKAKLKVAVDEELQVKGWEVAE
jgi:hypothetical protein